MLFLYSPHPLFPLPQGGAWAVRQKRHSMTFLRREPLELLATHATEERRKGNYYPATTLHASEQLRGFPS